MIDPPPPGSAPSPLPNPPTPTVIELTEIHQPPTLTSSTQAQATPPQQKQKQKQTVARFARCWSVAIQFFLIYSGTLLLAAFYFTSKDKTSITKVHYLALVYTPFAWLGLGTLVSIRTLEKDKTTRRAANAAVSFLMVLRCVFAYNANSPASFIGNFLFLVALFNMYKICNRLAKRLERKFKRNANKISNFECSEVPKTMLSTLTSMLFVCSESLSCMNDQEKLSFVSVEEHCSDIVDSNDVMLWFLVSAFFMRIYLIPHHEDNYTVSHLMRFDLHRTREQLAIVILGVSGLISLLVYATSEKKFDVFFEEDGTEKVVKVVSNKQVKMRFVVSFVAIAMIGSVPMTELLSKTFWGWFSKATQTSLRARIAPIYRGTLEILVVFIALSSSFYVYYAQREADGVEVGGEEDVVEKWRISSSDSVTLLLLFYALHFFGSPTARRRKRETAVALITLLFWLSHAYGSFLTKQTFSFAANIGWGLMMIPVYFMLKSSRKMLGSMHVDDIDAHLQSCISLCASTVPPILFLYAEPQSCVWYANSKANESYETEQCRLIQKCDFVVGGHLCFLFMFYVIFGYKLDGVSREGLLTLTDMQLHTVLQLMLFSFVSVMCLLVYGMRSSEKFAMQIFNEMPIAPIDTFLTSPMPNIIVSICWVLIFIIQMQHSHRMEVEATFFHRRSIEFMVHSSRFHTFVSNLDSKFSLYLAKFHLKEDDHPMIASPFRAMLFILAHMNLLVIGTVVFLNRWLNPATHYVLVFVFDEISAISWLTTITFIFTSLGEISVADKWLVGSYSVVKTLEVVTNLIRGVNPSVSIMFGLITLLTFLIMLRLKAKTFTKSKEARQNHCLQVLMAAVATAVPMLFLAGEYLGCLLRHAGDVEDKWVPDEFCNSTYLGTQSILFQLVFVVTQFASCELLTPAEEKITMRKVMTLELSRFSLMSNILLGLSGFFGIVNFGLRNEGTNGPTWQRLTFYSIYLLWFGVAVSDHQHLTGRGEKMVMVVGGSTRDLTMSDRASTINRSSTSSDDRTSAVTGITQAQKSAFSKRKTLSNVGLAKTKRMKAARQSTIGAGRHSSNVTRGSGGGSVSVVEQIEEGEEGEEEVDEDVGGHFMTLNPGFI